MNPNAEFIPGVGLVRRQPVSDEKPSALPAATILPAATGASFGADKTIVTAPSGVTESWESEPANGSSKVSSLPVSSRSTAEVTKEALVDDDDDVADIIDDGAEEAFVEVKKNKKAVVEEVIEEDPREHVTMVFCGHIDHGKSTLSGQILVLSGQVDDRLIEKYKRVAEEKKHASWYYAYIMDTNDEEQTKGITVEVGRANFATEKKRYTILDAPGHLDYVPNMITGAAQADVAVIVVSARKTEFEKGFQKGGQTREHAILLRTIGVAKLIIAVNKMDESTVNWSQERFSQICEEMTQFLKSIGYNPQKDLTFVAVSAFLALNIDKPMDKSVCPWYNGMCLFQALDHLAPFPRNPSAPLRIPVLHRNKEHGETWVFGKIESGTIQVGGKYFVMPGKIKIDVSALESTDEKRVRKASHGDNIRACVSGMGGVEIHPGYVICSQDQPVPVASKFVAQIAILEMLPHRQLFTSGYTAMLHMHMIVEEVKVTRLLSLLDKKTGAEVKKDPLFAKTGDVVKAILVTTQPICVEKFSDIPQLARLTLRDEGKTIGMGKVLLLHKSAVVGGSGGD